VPALVNRRGSDLRRTGLPPEAAVGGQKSVYCSLPFLHLPSFPFLHPIRTHMNDSSMKEENPQEGIPKRQTMTPGIEVGVSDAAE
jgi:hypothetical protein